MSWFDRLKSTPQASAAPVGDTSEGNVSEEEEIEMPELTPNPAPQTTTPQAAAPAAAAAAAVDTHPVLAAALAAGITTAEQFAGMQTIAAAARVELQTHAEKQAIRCFGQEAGPTKAAALKGASYEDAKTLIGLWQETADTRFGIGKEGEGAARITEAPDPDAVPPPVTALTPEEHEKLKAEGRKAYANMKGTALKTS